jgi:hypothetical protein
MEAVPKEDQRNDGRVGKASSPPKIYRKTVAKIGGVYGFLRKRWSERRDSNPFGTTGQFPQKLA